MTSSVLMFPFAKPDAPPPPVVVLLNATELFTKPLASLLAFEDLRPESFKSLVARTPVQRTRFHPYSHREMTATLPPEQPTQQPAPSIPPSAGDPPSVQDPLDTSPLSSPEPSPRPSPEPRGSCGIPLGVVSTKIKIEQPKGAGHKNLQDQVRWDPAFLTNVKKHARNLVHSHLDDSLCFKDQEQAKLELVRQEMVEKFPRLDDYEYLWPLDIIIMGLLKYSSSHGKGVSQKNAVDAVREFVGPTAPNHRPRRSAAK
ncbi:hypothetical protein BDZ94DRAFT_1313845 [Collybia nuda]|uniref:Uncharacterized protein n=1 Tax=Collybia nuda TaxID=64659 RepID=A0A9P6CEA6_9AGAR|nr:hypothetical protein BDZ94DRAFT_1313845 [Collybia nuda]